MKLTSTIDPQLVNIEGIEEPTIVAYFSTLNRGEFGAAAELFAETGCLQPPFENPIEGRDAIAKYLATEARGMILCPTAGAMLLRDDRIVQYHLQGQVKTNYFAINVSWLMQLNAAREIVLVEVKLLAALEELLKFKK
ncbi:nuclear transport factor 2 family protein [Chamaesiphon sp. OTE_20_metabat_361]|uniref:nuclear transport factor 2 family protein n=1 Tax=Chamaesiphon sp. OTE_20_metabat_361 TaxID=2964689 RepID=UPI00286AD29A|nr:nuclear transport factor 2 family protein [Chamaesiphon sp. OTE_20_metabat_361]